MYLFQKRGADGEKGTPSTPSPTLDIIETPIYFVFYSPYVNFCMSFFIQKPQGCTLFCHHPFYFVCLISVCIPWVQSLSLPLTAERQQLTSKLHMVATTKRLEEFQLIFLAFGTRTKVNTSKTQPARYHLTIPMAFIAEGSTVNWIIPIRSPVVSKTCLV